MSEAPANENGNGTREALRRFWRRRGLHVAVLCVIVPTLVAIVYYGFLASPEYVSVAIVGVETGDAGGHERTNSTSSPGPQSVRERILSRAMVDELAKSHGLREHYAAPSIDWLSRLRHTRKSESLFDYFLQKVAANIDSTGATVTVSVRAFSPQMAHDLAAAIVTSSERAVEETSGKAGRRLTEAAERSVADAEQRLTDVHALEPLVDSGDYDSELLASEIDLAREELTAARRRLETAEAEAVRRERHLVVVAAPSLPNEATYPRRAWSIATVFLAALGLVSIITLLGAAVREHSHL